MDEIATDMYDGSEIPVSQLGTGDYPAIRYHDVQNLNLFIHSAPQLVNEEAVKCKKYCEKGDLLITESQY